LFTEGYPAVIYCAGQSAEIMAKGCAEFIQKPYTLVDLSVKVSNVIGNAV
jgi:hypothetical protein